MTKKNLFLLFFVSTILNVISYSQNGLPYDISKVSNNKELNFALTDKRGIETEKGFVYYVENDQRVLTAYQDGKVKWKSDVIAVCGKPSVGRPEIRYIRLEVDKVYIVFGKHSFAYVYLSNGRVEYLGAD